MGRRVRAGVAFALVALAAVVAGCPTVDLGDQPAGVSACNPAGGLDYFTNKIWPMYVKHGDANLACTRSGGCHNEAGGNALTFKTVPLDFPTNYRAAQGYLNCGTPEMSDFLIKPMAGIAAHGGSDLFAMDAPEVQLFLGWFSEMPSP